MPRDDVYGILKLYRVYKKEWPILCNNLQYKIGYYFLDIRYLQRRIKVICYQKQIYGFMYLEPFVKVKMLVMAFCYARL